MIAVLFAFSLQFVDVVHDVARWSETMNYEHVAHLCGGRRDLAIIKMLSRDARRRMAEERKGVK